MSNNNGDHIVGITNDEGIKAPKDLPSGKHFPMNVVYSEGCLLLLGLTAIALDPLFFYIPMMKNKSTCLGLDKPLMIVVCILRTFVDVLHDCSWWHKSCGPIAQNSGAEASRAQTSGAEASGAQTSREWQSIMDRLQHFLEWIESFKISMPEGRSGIVSRGVAILASLPLPQVLVLTLGLQSGLLTWLMSGVTCQFIPRFFRAYPTYHAVAKAFNIYEWICGVINLVLFLIASHALGGAWYLRAVRRKMDCMLEACKGHQQCITSLYCKNGYYVGNGFINDTCSLQPTSNAKTSLDLGYGIYGNEVMSKVIGSTNIISKLTYGFWWGINNLSSMGQNLQVGSYIWDTLFAIFISILGLFLFALLIGNLQMYMQSSQKKELKERGEKEPKERGEMELKEGGDFEKEKELKEKKKKVKRDEFQIWASLFNLPKNLRTKVVSQYYEWQEVSEINLESLLNNVPSELRKELKSFFCKKMFNKVKKFEELKEEIKKELRERARPVVFQARTNIHEEGFPFCEMIHIVHGKVLAYNNDDVRQRSPAMELEKDDSFGEELLQEALESPSPILPVATQTIQSVTKVEAFVLSFYDFATVFTKYGKFIEPYKKLWAANVIKRAYRKHRGWPS